MSIDHSFDGLAEAQLLQRNLQAHFANLSERRAGRFPVFALEHGRSQGELELLEKSVRWMVRRGARLSKTPLPLVVYAAEVGYSYDGDEFWESFAAQTPGWVQNGDRSLIRRSFEDFSMDFGGARPTGAWARHFSIICWPILHAVLPRIFQRQLASILYENRWRLSPALIEEPLRLGTLIETWAWGASDRFRNLAQNHELLGHVASALLLQSGESAMEALLPETVERVITDLSRERDAKRWLREASRFATTTTARGFSPPQARASNESPGQSPPGLNPVLRLQQRGSGWAVVAELPDLGPLVERFPELGRELSMRRCFVTGRTTPLPRSALLWPGQWVELDAELKPQPFLSLEGQADQWSPLLGDFCQLPPPPWLFRVQDGEGVQVLGRFVRPGAEYVLATDASPSNPLITESVNGPSIGLSFVMIRVRDGLDATEISALEDIGLSVQSSLEVWPAGVCNAGWDGVGAAVWLEGDRVQIGVEADRFLHHLIVSGDGDAHRVMCSDGGPTFLDLGYLSVGAHLIQLEAFDESQPAPLAVASMQVQVRARHARPATGSLREGLALTAAPGAPTLNELLEGSCALELAGPAGARIDVTLSLRSGRRETPLARLDFSDKLAIAGSSWTARIVQQVRSDRAFMRKIEDADACTVRFSHADLGEVEIRAEREFAPIRLATGVDHDGRYARLVDNMDGQLVTLTFSTVEHPDDPRPAGDPSVLGALRFEQPGLLTATGGEFEASVVLAPDRVRDFRSLGAGDSQIRLARRPRSIESLRELCRLAHRWRHAAKPDLDASLTSLRVLRAITCEIAALVGGKYWAAIEHRVDRQETPPRESMVEALGSGYSQTQLIHAVQRRMPRPAEVTQQDLVNAFNFIAEPAIGQPRLPEALILGEFCLRLASQPASVAFLDDVTFSQLATAAIQNPVLLRLARYLVLQIDEHFGVTDEYDESFRGFTWA